MLLLPSRLNNKLIQHLPIATVGLLYSRHTWDSLILCPDKLKGGVLISWVVLYTFVCGAYSVLMHFRGVLIEGFHSSICS